MKKSNELIVFFIHIISVWVKTLVSNCLVQPSDWHQEVSFSAHSPYPVNQNCFLCWKEVGSHSGRQSYHRIFNFHLSLFMKIPVTPNFVWRVSSWFLQHSLIIRDSMWKMSENWKLFPCRGSFSLTKCIKLCFGFYDWHPVHFWAKFDAFFSSMHENKFHLEIVNCSWSDTRAVKYSKFYYLFLFK